MLRCETFVSAAVLCLVATGCNTPRASFNPFAGYGSPRVPPPATGGYVVPNNYYPNATTPTGSASRNTIIPPVGTSTIPVGNDWRPAGTVTTPDLGSSAAVIGSGAANQNGVVQATYVQSSLNATNPLIGQANSTTVIAPQAVTPSTSQLNPMQVNDATGAAQPKAFVAQGNVVEMSQLPAPIRPAIPGSNRIRGFTVPYAVAGSVPYYAESAGQVVIPGSIPQGTVGSPGVVIAPGALANQTPTVIGTNPSQLPTAAPTRSGTEIGWRPKYTPPTTNGTMIR